MEYLYFSSGSLSESEALALFNARRASYRRAEACRAAGPHGLVTNGAVAEEAGTLYALFGSAFVGESFLNNFAPRTAAETIRACKAIAQNPGHASGTFTGIIADRKTGDARFLLDDLNAAPCFVAHHGRHFAVSGNVHMLAGWLLAQGVTPTRTVEPALSHLVFSSGLTAGNLYREIATVQPEERPEIRRGKLALVRNDPVWPGLLSASYDELIDEAARVIRQRIAMLTETGTETFRVFDITGGMDSRIVLAAVIGGGLGREWLFHNHYNPRHPDSHFAHFVAEKWGIRQWPREKAEVLPPLGKALVDLYLSFGTELKGAAHADLYRPSFLHVTGCFGELGGKSQDTSRFRTVQPPVPDPAAMQAPRGLLGRLFGRRPPAPEVALQAAYVEAYLNRAGLLGDRFGFDPAMLAWARQATARQIERARGADLDFDQMPVIFYRHGKARSHFGMDAFLRGMREQYAGVLNTPFTTAAAVRIGSSESRLGRVNFDLIRRLGGDEIAALPLVDTYWPPALFSSEDDKRRFTASPITSGSDILFKERVRPDPVPAPNREPLREALWAKDDPDAAQPPAEPTTPVQRRTAGLVALADHLLREGPVSDAVTAYLPETAIRALVTGDPAAYGPPGPLIHVLQFFCQAEMWMRGMEEAPFAA